MILEGWRDALWSGRYIAVRYDCASPSVAHWINRLARKVGLTDSAFMATVQTTPEEIAALSPTLRDDEPAFNPGSAAASVPGADQETQVALVPAPAPPQPVRVAPREPPPAADVETPEATAERLRAYREIFGIEDPKPPPPVAPLTATGPSVSASSAPTGIVCFQAGPWL